MRDVTSLNDVTGSDVTGAHEATSGGLGEAAAAAAAAMVVLATASLS